MKEVKKGQSILLPSHIVPTKPILLGRMKIEKGMRVNHSYAGGGSHTNSLLVSEYADNNQLNDWIKFHSFVTSSRVPLNFYRYEDHPDKLEVLEFQSQYPKDFDVFTDSIYYREPELAKKITDKSYISLYETYEALVEGDKDLISSFLINLDDRSGRADRQLFDQSYWQIVNMFSILEKVVGQPKFCTKHLSCDACGQTGLQHHRIPAKKWLEQQLSERMADSGWLNTYLELIVVARERIRKRPVHLAQLPKTSYPSHEPNGQVDYTHKKTLQDYEIDTHALRALSGMIESVTWHILMDYLFHHNVFERPTGYSVGYITVNIKSDQLKKK